MLNLREGKLSLVLQQEKDGLSAMPNVWWMGQGHSRTITATDWAKHNITAISVTWNYQNGYAVDQAEFTSAQLDVLAEDVEFLTGQEGVRTISSPWIPPEEELPPIIPITDFVYYSAMKQYYDAILGIYNELPGVFGYWWFGSGVPGTITNSKVGDCYLDFTSGNVYRLEA